MWQLNAGSELFLVAGWELPGCVGGGYLGLALGFRVRVKVRVKVLGLCVWGLLRQGAAEVGNGVCERPLC